MAKKYQIEIPDSAFKKTDFSTNEELSLSVNHKQINIRPINVSDQLPKISISWYVIPSIILAAIFLAFFSTRKINTVPITGDDYSIANGALILGVCSGILSFLITFIITKILGKGPSKDFHWRSLPTITIACGLIIAFSLSAIFWLFGQM
ncbi:MAG: ABC transporter permease, partial [Limosilactobacillus reuteri]|nr:ABC transporter permease [Limosilactobacillus reuteri]